MGLLGGLFGGGGFSGGGAFNSTSSNPVTNNTTNKTETINTVDNRIGEDGAVFGGNVTLGPGDISGTVTIQNVDQGAVLAGKDIALESLKGIGAALNATQSVASDSISQAYGLANEARQSETSGAINNLVKYATWVALAGICAYAITKYGK